jgi:4-hydroxy-3-polyprenylbenzoate decarboxylase
MEHAKRIWEELGLPKLRPEMPWYGYDLGEWNDHLERQAQLAVQSEYGGPANGAGSAGAAMSR